MSLVIENKRTGIYFILSEKQLNRFLRRYTFVCAHVVLYTIYRTH